MKLTDAEHAKVLGLRNDAVFMGIIHKVIQNHPVPVYSKGKETDDWIFQSGVVRGIQILAKTLGYTNDRDSKA